MLRARRWLVAAIVALGVAWLSGPGWRPTAPEAAPEETVAVKALGALAQAVSWPVSSGLLVSEVVTGGASASDEFVEIYNASADAIELGGLELVYATSSGSTVTRKQTWTALSLPSHRHLLLANSGGLYASSADGLYSGGFAATGGSLVLRTLGGAVVDSLSWGDAASQFVEGAGGPAAAAGSSLERRPGGAAGNAADTNDNLSDTHVESSPVAQNLAAAAVPAAAPSPTAAPTPSMSAAPTSTPTESPSAPPSSTAAVELTAPVATETAPPSPSPTPATPSPSPTPTATASATATAPATASPTLNPTMEPTTTPSAAATESPSPAPTELPSPTAETPSQTPDPTATPMSIAFVRTEPIGACVFVRGLVAAEIGTVLGATTFAIRDETAGILVKLPADASLGLVLGDEVEVEGLLAAPYGNLEIRPAAEGVRVIGPAVAPSPRDLVAAELGESTEGLLARLTGRLTRMESSSSGSLTLFLTDSTGEGRVFLDARFGLHTSDFAVGQTLAVSGIVGDRLGLYRLWPRSYSDIELIAAAPTQTATPTPSPSPTPSPTRTPTPAPHITPTPAPPSVSIAEALGRQGEDVAVEGVVTTKPGLLDADGQRVVVQDATAAVVVRLPADAAAHVGRRLHVIGTMTTYYGAPSLTALEARDVGEGSVEPQSVERVPLAASLEWQLVTVSGRVEFVHRDGDAWRAELTVSGVGIPISGVARSGISSTALVAGRTATITGIVRRAYPTASDQRFMVVPRSAADIRLGPAVRPQPSGSTGNGHGSNATPSAALPGASMAPASSSPQQAGGQSLGDLAGHESEIVSVGGLITAVVGVRLTIEDDSATAVLRLIGDAAPLAGLFGLGDLVNATGTVERTPDDGIEIVVDDPAGLRRLSQPAAPATAAPSPGSAQTATYEPRPSAEAASQAPLAALVLLAAAAVLALIGLGAAYPRLREPVRARLVTLRRS